MSVSWATPEPAVRPRVLLSGPAGSRVASAVRRTYTDGLSGELVYTYHAQLTGLLPDASYSYAVTADNDRSPAPFSATFRTAPRGRAPFRFTSFADLATPNPAWARSYGQAACAVAAVESFQPLFHLLNGDLCYADLSPAHQPAVWRDFGNNAQSSAAQRAWMPCPGNHEIEFGNGPQGLASYLTRYTLPDNGVPGFRGRWYSFRVGSALFVSLDADDVVFQDGGPLVAGPDPLVPAPAPGPRPSRRAPRSISAAIRRGRRRPGWTGPWPRPGVTPRSTGSSCRCTRTRCPRRPPVTAVTWGSGRPGCRCSTGTRWTWC